MFLLAARRVAQPHRRCAWRRASTLHRNIRQLLAASGAEDVQVSGWVKSVRRQKRVVFAVISDGSEDDGLQAVFLDPARAGVDALSTGASVTVTGRMVVSTGTKQAKELHVDELQIVGMCDPQSYPIQKKELSDEYLRTLTHLRARTVTGARMIRARDILTRSIHNQLGSDGFVHVHTPILTLSDCEGAGEAFRAQPPGHRPDVDPAVDMFGHQAFLTVSHQLHLEAACAAFPRVYSLAPCFRAERSATNRHLNEFWMLEVEQAFIDDLETVMRLLEGVVNECIRQCASQLSNTLPAPGTEKPSPWPRVSYTDAIAALECYHADHPDAFAFTPSWGAPLRSEHERWLARAGPIFVTHYPAALKPFYMLADPGAPTVACFDLLVPGMGELAGGSLRVDRADALDAALAVRGLDANEYTWYRELRTFGSAPHGGFGLGFERLVAWILGADNVKDCVPFPRWAGNWRI